MTATAAPTLASRLVNGVLSIKPLAKLAKNRARNMMIKRAESIGVYWRQEVAALKARDWSTDLAAVQNPNLQHPEQYPDYYVTSFHAYEEGNLGWEPALEVEVAAYAVHARIWPEAGAAGDSQLRQSYHDVLKAQLPEAPKEIVDLGCSVGMSTFALQTTFPEANLTGVDLSPYFLAVAKYRSDERQGRSGIRDQGSGIRDWGLGIGEAEENQNSPATSHDLQTNRSIENPKSTIQNPSFPTWVHAAAEATGLPAASYDLVSACLVFHELPQSAAIAILQEARRLLRPNGHLAIMDMNPRSEVFARMPPYILTLLKSTEPYLDQYFALDIEQAIDDAGFERPTITCNSPRHRTIVAKVRS
ncbi:class I SAM-dependent methyltransferase [Leptodesmis sichuanensis]|uniref:class I SAM-dependent methyltransferase n=1 Tax=Leptodesmis sichuanensis TaxID=2906798 RepID=UPI001F1F212E|nr:class I SAM-dependent methyltransferase [Leptodesmis sichuanensis]UIE37954.1 class I SAM-dependent methyltransferase [Leptodesmis sichuanensis A121]